MKTAAAATRHGATPEIFVFNAGSNREAERTYRRLARVAIAHLGCTPIFAGRHLEPLAADHPLCGAPVTLVEQADAEQVYQAIARHCPELTTELKIANEEPVFADEEFATGESALPGQAANNIAEENFINTDCQQSVAPDKRNNSSTNRPASFVSPIKPSRATSPTERAIFRSWQPASADEILTALADAVEALLPQGRGAVRLRDVVSGANRPDALAADAAGRPVAILLAPGGEAPVLQQALAAHLWVNEHVRLMTLAFPLLGLDSAALARSVVIGPAGVIEKLAALCPRGVALASYTPVAFGAARGLVFQSVPSANERRELAAQSVATACADVAAGRRAFVEVTIDRQTGETFATAPQAAPAPTPRHAPGTTPDCSRLAGLLANVQIRAHETDYAPAESPRTGSSPDDDLSADEINALHSE